MFRCLVLALSYWMAPSPAAGPERPARDVLERAARAYRAVPSLRDTLSYTVKAPGSREGWKKIEIHLGSGRDAAVADPVLEATAASSAGES